MQSVPRVLLSGICLSMLGGCAVAVMLSLGPEQRAAMFLVPADRGVIYVYGVEDSTDSAATEVFLDGEKLGPPSTAGFWYRDVVPGTHSIAVTSGADPLLVAVEAGHTYFVGEEVECVPGMPPALHAIGESEGRAHVRALYAASKTEHPSEKNPHLACARAAPAVTL